MKISHLGGALALLLGASLPVSTRAADAGLVLDWQERAIGSIESLPRPRQGRAGVMLDLAVFNALNAIEPRYRGYGPALEPSPTALPEAAVAAAVWGVLSTEPEAENAKLARAYADAIAKLPEGAARNAGITLGQRAAAAMLALRAGDSFDRIDGPKPVAAAGVFQAIPGAKMPFKTRKEASRPFAVASVDAFDPGPPPVAGSASALRDLTESKAYGSRIGNSRSADQTAAALFWNSGESTDDLEFLKPLMAAQKLSALDAARLLALGSMADFDTSVAISTFKLKYQHWRPITALRSDFTPAALRDAAWEPLVRTPVDPDYPSGGAAYAGTLEVVSDALQVKAPERSNAATRQTRYWPSVDAMASELQNARVWAGIHSRSAVVAGRQVGHKIAAEVFASQLQPLPK